MSQPINNRSITETYENKDVVLDVKGLRVYYETPKGDVLATARIAGIQAAKRTAELIPLCHPLPLDRIDVELTARSTGHVMLRSGQASSGAAGGFAATRGRHVSEPSLQLG